MTTTRTAAHPLRRFDTFDAYLPDYFDAATIVRDHYSWRFDAIYRPNPRFEPTLRVVLTLVIPMRFLPEDPTTVLVPRARLVGYGEHVSCYVGPTEIHPDEVYATRCTVLAPKRRPERQFHRSGFTFGYGVLAEDFDPSQILEAHEHYRFCVEVEDPDPSSELPQTWVLTVPAGLLTPRRLARLRPSAEVLFVAHLFPSGVDWLADDPAEDSGSFYGSDSLVADVVRFAVVSSRRRSRTRYVRPVF